jgi:hypothetical protein
LELHLKKHFNFVKEDKGNNKELISYKEWCY